MDKTEDLRPTTTPYPPVAPSAEPAAIEAVPPPSTLQRTIHALRKAVPLVQRLLPILDGNIAATVVNVLASQAVAPAPSVDLAPVEESVSKLRVQNSLLHDQLDEQNLALKRLEQRLEAVREAADRSTLEQQEILDSVKKNGQNLKIFAFVGLALLLISVLLNLALLLHLERALR
jgi:hypothetical protein